MATGESPPLWVTLVGALGPFALAFGIWLTSNVLVANGVFILTLLVAGRWRARYGSPPVDSHLSIVERPDRP